MAIHKRQISAHTGVLALRDFRYSIKLHSAAKVRVTHDRTGGYISKREKNHFQVAPAVSSNSPIEAIIRAIAGTECAPVLGRQG